MLRSISLAALVITAAHAQAGDLVPLGGESIELGSIHGIAYYSQEPSGYRIITTLAEGETGLPVRFEAILADHQKLIISVPGKAGESGPTLEILRAGDKVILSRPKIFADKLAVPAD